MASVPAQNRNQSVFCASEKVRRLLNPRDKAAAATAKNAANANDKPTGWRPTEEALAAESTARDIGH